MKTRYSIVYSDIKNKRLPRHLPVTHSTTFRKFLRAMNEAKRLHRQNRDVVLSEHNEEGLTFTWEFTAGYETIVFSDGTIY